jgi:hypothetical protein
LVKVQSRLCIYTPNLSLSFRTCYNVHISKAKFLHTEKELHQLNVTLDTNCIIALEENRPTAPFLRQLITFHDAKKINLRVVAISASERKRDGTYAANFSEFKQKIATVGVEHVDILKPIAYLGMAYLDWCYPSGGQATVLERKIHEILFPSIEFDYLDYRHRFDIDLTSDEIDPKWRNAKCDVLAMWSHIRFYGDVFVTSDKNFHKQRKKEQLIALGAGNILTPQEAVSTVAKN